MKDNIGNDLNIGDYVFCLSGTHKNTIQQIKKFRITKDHFGDRDAVDFINGSWLLAYNTISITALGVNTPEVSLQSGCDILGNTLHTGDMVLYRHPMEYYAEVGIVKKLAAKSCLLEIKPNRFGETEYRKKYEELVSLTALKKEDIVIMHCYD